MYFDRNYVAQDTSRSLRSQVTPISATIGPICPKLVWMDLAPIRVKYLVSKIPNRSKGQHRTTVHSLDGKLVWTTRSRENLGFITESQVLNKWAPICNAALSSAVRGCTCASGCTGLEDETLVSGCRTRRFCFTAPLLRGSSIFLITFKQNVIPVKPSTTETIPEIVIIHLLWNNPRDRERNNTTINEKAQCWKHLSNTECFCVFIPPVNDAWWQTCRSRGACLSQWACDFEPRLTQQFKRT